MKKRLLSILLIAAMLLTMLPVSALAQTATGRRRRILTRLPT